MYPVLGEWSLLSRDAGEDLESNRCQTQRFGEKGVCYLEKVHSMPKQGVKSMFTFGQNYGFVRACFHCFNIPFIEIAPKVWQKKLGCLTGGDKKVTRGKAQQLFPLVDPVTNAIADAMLLAWSARVFMED